MLYTPYIWPQLLAASLMVGLALYARRLREMPSVRPFILLMWLVVVWALAYAFNISTLDFPLKFFWQQFQMLPTLFIAPATLALALEYVDQGRQLTRKRLALVLTIPVIAALLLLSSPYHTLFRYDFNLDLSGPMPLMLTAKGPFYWVYLAYTYGIIVLAGGILLTASRIGTLRFRNARLIAAGLFIPLLANMLYQFGFTPIRGYDWSLLSFSISGLLYVWAILRRRLFSITPVARNTVMEAIDDLVIVLDTQNQIADFNRAARVVCHLTPRSIGATPDTLPPAWADLFHRYENRDFGKEQVTLNLEDVQHIYDLTISPIRDERAHLQGRLFLLHDISALKQAEEALRESERTARAILNAPPNFALLVDPLGRILDLNKTAAAELGLSVEVAIGRCAWDFLPPAVAASRMANIAQVMKTGAPVRWDDEHAGQYFENSVYPVTASEGGVKRLVILGADITARKQAEETLRNSEQRYHRLMDNAPIGILSIDIHGQIVDANPKMADILGSPTADATKTINVLTFSPLVEAGFAADFRQCLETSESSASERFYRTNRGKAVHVRMHLTPISDAQGSLAGVQAVVEDITVRKEAEAEKQAVLEELRQEYRRLDDIIDFLPDATLVVDREGWVIAWNRAMEIMTEVQKNDMLGLGDQAYSVPFYGKKRPILIDLALLPDQDFEEANYQNVQRKGELLIAEAQTPGAYGGRGAFLLGTATRLRNAAGEVIGAIESISDITERKQAEEALRASETKFRWLAENVHDIIWLADLDFRFTYISPAVARILGFTPEEALQTTLPQNLTPDSVEVMRQAQAQREQAEATGLSDWVSRLEIQQYHKNGTPVWMEVLTQPMFDEQDHHKIGYLGVSRNIAERKAYEQELQQAKDAAETANRAKSTFLSNMSHELRTPLNAILGFSEFISRAENLTTNQRENLFLINQSGEHLLQIINDILEISKIEAGRNTLQEEDFDLHSLMQNLENILRMRAQQQNIDLIFNLSPETPRYIRTDQGKLRQVLMNLLSNALKFSPNGQVTLDLLVDPVIPERLMFAIEDTGVGIAPEEIGLLFNAFAQTSSGKKAQQGTGLGLAISRAFVQLMGGEITVHSQPNQGSSFEFDIRFSPVEKLGSVPQPYGKQPHALGLQPGQHAPDGGPYRMLVVEDVDANRLLMESLLRALGQPIGGNAPAACLFEVRSVSNGQEAIEAWRDWQPHLIWMDIRMPVMDGLEATRYIKSHLDGRSTVIIALTATAFEEDRLQAFSAGMDGFVRKPYREKYIISALVEHLGVKFVYENPAGQDAPELEAAPTPVAAEPLPTLPAAWLKDMQQALIQGEVQWLRQLAEQIRPQSPTLADRLAGLVENFELDEISKLIQ